MNAESKMGRLDDDAAVMTGTARGTGRATVESFTFVLKHLLR
jgi:hypothetical protein